MAIELIDKYEVAAYIMIILIELYLEPNQEVPLENIKSRLIGNEFSLIEPAFDYLRERGYIHGNGNNPILSQEGFNAMKRFKKHPDHPDSPIVYVIKRGIF